MKKAKILFFAFFTLYFVFSAEATEINFDDVASFTAIDSQYAGVLFSTLGVVDGYSDGHAYARSSSLSISSPNVIGGNRSGYTYLNDAYIIGMAEFAVPVSSVEIWAKPYSGEYLFAWMSAYDNLGNLVDATSLAGDSQSASILSVAGQDIYKVKFAGASKRVVFDGFSYNTAVAPEPISTILFVVGGLTLAARRRLKNNKK